MTTAPSRQPGRPSLLVLLAAYLLTISNFCEAFDRSRVGRPANGVAWKGVQPRVNTGQKSRAQPTEPAIRVEMEGCAGKKDLEFLREHTISVEQGGGLHGVFLSLEYPSLTEPKTVKKIYVGCGKGKPKTPKKPQTPVSGDLTAMRNVFLDENIEDQSVEFSIGCLEQEDPLKRNELSTFVRHSIILEKGDKDYDKFAGRLVGDGRKLVYGFKSDRIGKGCAWTGGYLLQFRERLAKKLGAEFIDLLDDSKIECGAVKDISLRHTYPLLKNDRDMKSWYQAKGYEWQGYGDSATDAFGCVDCLPDLISAEKTVGHATMRDALSVLGILSKMWHSFGLPKVIDLDDRNKRFLLRFKKLAQFRDHYNRWIAYFGYDAAYIEGSDLAFPGEDLDGKMLFDALRDLRSNTVDAVGDLNKNAQCEVLEAMLMPLTHKLDLAGLWTALDKKESLHKVIFDLPKRVAPPVVEEEKSPMVEEEKSPMAGDEPGADDLATTAGSTRGDEYIDDDDETDTTLGRDAVGQRGSSSLSLHRQRLYKSVASRPDESSRARRSYVNKFTEAREMSRAIENPNISTDEQYVVTLIMARLLHKLYTDSVGTDPLLRFDLGAIFTELLENETISVLEQTDWNPYKGVEMTIVWSAERQAFLQSVVALQRGFGRLGTFRKHIPAK